MKNEKVEIIKVDDISLSATNPRFETLNSIGDDLIEFIKSKNSVVEEEVISKEKEILMKILLAEGDLSTMVSLMESIESIGFKSEGDEILVVDGNDGAYIVAEGNRRITAMKLMLGLLEFPPLKKLEAKSTNIGIEDLYNEDDENIMLSSKKSSNYKKIQEIIKNVSKDWKIKNESIKVKIIYDSEILWRMIYTKHIAGDRPGMRKWTRGKYFVDILHLFPEGIGHNVEEEKRTLWTIQRDIKTIKQDYKQAQFIRDVFLSKCEEKTSKELKSVYEKMKSNKISALQTNFSLSTIQKYSCEILNITKQEFEKNFFSIAFDQKHKIKYTCNNIPKKSILSFILRWYNKRVLTTRPISKDKLDEFILELSQLLDGFVLRTNLSENELSETDSFLLTTRQLENIIDDFGDDITPTTKKRFIYTKKILEQNEKIKNISSLKSIDINDPSSVFKRLHNQLKHNTTTSGSKIYLNAAAATMRSMIEQIVIWGAYFVKEIIEQWESGSESFENKKKSWALAISENRIYRLFNKIKREFWVTTNIKNILKGITNETLLEEARFLSQERENIDDVLNEFIHASHRIYKHEKFQENLEIFSNFQSNLITIMNKISNENIELLNKEIKTIISSNE